MCQTTIKLNPVSVGKKLRYTPFNTANRRMHWAANYRWKCAWEEETMWSIYLHKKKLGELPLRKPRIRIVLKTIRLMDKDGSYTSIKPIMDGIVKAGVLKDDSLKYVDYFVEQKKVKHIKDQGVEIIIRTFKGLDEK